jgi:K+-sensing histidine kinase KdpD
MITRQLSFRFETQDQGSIHSSWIVYLISLSQQKVHGMGLGLALCRMIIERHEGKLVALPAGPRGSVFRVAPPIGKADA